MSMSLSRNDFAKFESKDFGTFEYFCNAFLRVIAQVQKACFQN